MFSWRGGGRLVLVQIRFIKDTEDGYKRGNIVRLSERDAEEIIKTGYAEVYNEVEQLTPIKIKAAIREIVESCEEEGDEIICAPKIRALAKNNGYPATDFINLFKKLVRQKFKEEKKKNPIIKEELTFSEQTFEDYDKEESKKLKKVEVIPKVNVFSSPPSKIDEYISGGRSPERDAAIRYLTERAGLTEIYKEVEEDDYEFIERTLEEIREHEGKLRKEIKTLIKEAKGNIVTIEPIITEYLARYFRDNYKIFTIMDDKCEEIWIYEDGIYVPQGKSRILQVLRRILREHLTPDRSNKVLIKVRADTFIDQKDFFNVNYLTEIPVQNGILDLNTREIKKFTPFKIFFNKLPMEYNPEARCNNVDSHFASILKGPDEVKVMYELFGYCLWKDNFLEKAVMFYAGGRNGKTKTLELLKTFIGPLNTVSVPLQNLSDNSFEVAELFGKMVNMAGDISTEEIKHSGIIKMLTGRDTLTAKRKFLTGLTFTNFSKLIFACNELPRVYDNSRGFWSRWIIFEFPYIFIKKEELDELPIEERANKKIMDPDIVKKLTTPEELSGLLNIALDGLDRIKKNKGFSYSKGVDEVMNFWIRNSDSFLAFCLDFVEGDYTGKISKLNLRKRYADYCRKYQVKTVSDKAIKRTLQDNYGIDEEYTSVFGNHQEWSWVGIKWKLTQNAEIGIKV